MLFIYKPALSNPERAATHWLLLWPLRPPRTLQCLFPIIIQFNVITMVIRFPVKYLSDMVVWVPGCVELVPLGRPERQLD